VPPAIRRVAGALAIFGLVVLVQPGGAAAQAERLTVMTFNVWYGGVQVDFDQIGSAIRAARADVVGVQEPEGSLRRIARSAGMPYVDESLHLISRYPLFGVRRDDVRLGFAALDLDHVVAIANVHLTATPYGPELAASGRTARQVLRVERQTRLPEITPYLRPFGRLARADVPVFLIGDMNSPSHLDWTPAAVGTRPQVRFPLEWPVSSALAEGGFRDSYREAHPDPVANPGLTWTPGTPPPRIRRRETLDRIDWVMASGPATTLSSALVGEVGGPDVDIGLSRWGSDHRAVASTFEVTPGPAPPLVSAVPRVARAGQRVTIRYTRTRAGPGRRIGILPARGRSPIMTLPIYDASDHLAAFFGTGRLAPGRYRAALIDGDGSVAATSPFWVLAPGARPRIRPAKRTYAPGEPIRLRWRNAPGNKLEWIGIFRAGATLDLYNYLGFRYVGARPNGRLAFTTADLGRLPPGRYVAGLMMDDGYTLLARAGFRIERRR
jgi:endonuclease/exonuclease/phosphatase family metal-dependent hydrolase